MSYFGIELVLRFISFNVSFLHQNEMMNEPLSHTHHTPYVTKIANIHLSMFECEVSIQVTGCSNS